MKYSDEECKKLLEEFGDTHGSFIRAEIREKLFDALEERLGLVGNGDVQIFLEGHLQIGRDDDVATDYDVLDLYTALKDAIWHIRTLLRKRDPDAKKGEIQGDTGARFLWLYKWIEQTTPYKVAAEELGKIEGTYHQLLRERDAILEANEGDCTAAYLDQLQKTDKLRERVKELEAVVNGYRTEYEEEEWNRRL